MSRIWDLRVRSGLRVCPCTKVSPSAWRHRGWHCRHPGGPVCASRHRPVRPLAQATPCSPTARTPNGVTISRSESQSFPSRERKYAERRFAPLEGKWAVKLCPSPIVPKLTPITSPTPPRRKSCWRNPLRNCANIVANSPRFWLNTCHFDIIAPLTSDLRAEAHRDCGNFKAKTVKIR